MWKRFAEDYLSYSYKERTGIYILLTLISCCILIPFIYPFVIAERQYDHSKFENEIARLEVAEPDVSQSKKYISRKAGDDNFNDYGAPSEKRYDPGLSEVFYFDPNNATPVEWKRLGVKTRTIETIQKYISKGGHFYKPEDIGKIWGLSAGDIKRLVPYVRITAKEPGYKKNMEGNAAEIKRVVYVPRAVRSLDINTADTTEFIDLPGIGSKLALRIVNFRSKLGGFYSVEQVRETFGLQDSIFEKIKPRLTISGTPVKKININTVLLDQLKSHPYIRYAIANAIIQYRTMHGNFSSIADVKKVMLITDDVFDKMAPYISISEY